MRSTSDMLPDEPLPIVPPAIEPPVPDIVVFPPGVAEAVEGEVPMFSIPPILLFAGVWGTGDATGGATDGVGLPRTDEAV